MGLLIQMPTGNNCGDRKIETKNSVELRSYGLPYIFWFYLLCGWVAVTIMYLGIKGPLNKLALDSNPINYIILGGAYFVLFIAPILFTLFYFYEKRFVKTNTDLKIEHRIFFIQIWQKNISLEDKDSFKIQHFLDSPNMARINQHPDYKGFENKGYFELLAKTSSKSWYRIDRSNRKQDLIDLQSTLSRFYKKLVQTLRFHSLSSIVKSQC